MRSMLSFAVLISLLLVSNSRAGVWYVKPDSTGAAPNIQAGIDSCTSGDTVLASPGTYTGAGNRDIDFAGKAIVVMSLSGPDVTIIDCEGSEAEYHRGFYFHSGEDTSSVLQGFTIRNGYADEGGAIHCYAASPRLVGNFVTASFAITGGGGIYCEGTHSVISGNTISGNAVTSRVALQDAQSESNTHSNSDLDGETPWYGGGGICCVDDSSAIEDNLVKGNTTTAGSAIYLTGSVVRLRNNTVIENFGWMTDGTILCCNGTYTIENNVVTDNAAWFRGAGISCSGGVFRIIGNTISYNHGHGQFSLRGGGLCCWGGNYTIEDNEITGNEAAYGNGIYFEGSGSIRNNTISGNRCSGDRANRGGGIAIGGSGSSLVVANNIISRNSAPLGGGISCDNSSAEITDNIISNNGAFYNVYRYNESYPLGGLGGGIYCSFSSPIIARNTIVSNSVSGYREEVPELDPAGAGIFCTQASSPSIYQNIIADNYVQYARIAGGGGIFCEDSTSAPSISCCDVYGNTNANYGGTLADQTGLNGNFSLDPIFCAAASSDYQLHFLSPCMPGNHPDGIDCGLIGAMGGACDYVATLLQGYWTNVSSSAVTITWTLSQAGENLTCSVLRAEAGDGEYRELLASGITTDGLSFTFNDATFDPGTAYRYRVHVSDNEGRRVLFETSQIVTPVLPLSLYQNFPNPFNPSTTISYYLPQDSPVTLAVYDVSGRRVADLIAKLEKKGRHSVTWNAKDEAGSSLASGMYFYRLTVGKETISKKMVLLR
jgi:putative cofactor-binding repeat protein